MNNALVEVLSLLDEIRTKIHDNATVAIIAAGGKFLLQVNFVNAPRFKKNDPFTIELNLDLIEMPSNHILHGIVDECLRRKPI